MIGTIINVATGSILKVLGAVVSGYFENKRLTVLALSQKTEHLASLYGGTDTADDFTKFTRRIIAWMFAFTLCFTIALAALNADWGAVVIENRERTGLWGFLTGGRQATTRSFSSEVIFMAITLLEIMFGFYFTKVRNT